MVGCAKAPTPDLPHEIQHETFVLGGYYRHIGPEIVVSAANELELLFARPITVVKVPKNSPLTISRNEERLLVRYTGDLTKAGEPLTVRTLDAREFRLRLTAPTEEHPAEPRIVVGSSTVHAERVVSPRAQLLRDPEPVMPSGQTVDALRAALLTGRAASGITELPDLKGRVYAHNERITAVVQSAFRRDGYIGYKLRVVNRLDSPLAISRGLFASDRLVSMTADHPILAAAEPRFKAGGDAAYADGVTVYLIDRATPLAAFARTPHSGRVAQTLFLNGSDSGLRR